MKILALLMLLGLAAGARACRTAADVLARELPSMQLSPVFQHIYGNPNLKGVMLVPTEDAWKALEATAALQNVNLKGENITAAAMTGGLALYWLAQDSALSLSDLAPGAAPLKVDTEARWRCSLPEKMGSVGYGYVLRRGGDGSVTVEHGGSQQARGMFANVLDTEPLKGTCPGLKIYRVDAVPLPCSSLAAIAAEVNDPSQAGCQRNAGNSVSHALAAGGRTHFLQLVLATGLLPAIDKTAGAFTIFAPSDAAVEAAGAAGTFDYGNLFATNKDLLRQIVGYHIASGQALLQPSQGSASSLAPTLMKGDPGCGAGGAPSWRADGLVRGGRGVARAGAPVEACHSSVVPIDALLLPCCATYDDLLSGTPVGAGYGAGRNTTALAEAPQFQGFLANVADIVKQSAANTTQVILAPSQAAWSSFLRSAAKAGVEVDGPMYAALAGALVAQHHWGVDVSKILADPTHKIALASKMPDAAMARLCPNGTGRFGLTLASTAPAPPAARRRLAALAAPPAAAPGIEVTDGLEGKRRITVTGWDQMCGGSALMFIDAVPLGCELAPAKAAGAAAQNGTGAPGAAAAAQNGAARAAGAAAAAAIAAVAAALL